MEFRRVLFRSIAWSGHGILRSPRTVLLQSPHGIPPSRDAFPGRAQRLGSPRRPLRTLPETAKEEPDMTTPKAVHFLEGKWVEGNPPIMGPMTHAAWMASVVFDGARAFEGVTPDLDRHCERLVRSAYSFGLKPVLPGRGAGRETGVSRCR